MRARAWLQAARPLAHANIAPPIVLGMGLAARQGSSVELEFVALALGFGVLDHLAIVLANDYADREGDTHHAAPTLFSGGSRVIQQGLLPARALARAAALAAAALLVLSGLGAVVLDRPLLPALAALALALLFAYSFPPLRLAYRGGGELLQGLGVGAVLPIVGFYAVAGSMRSFPWLALLPLVILGSVSNVLTALPDTHADRAAGKRSWPVRRGEGRARVEALVGLSLVLALVLLFEPGLPWSSRAAMVAPPCALLALSLASVRAADAEHRARCLRFVAMASGVGFTLHVAWAIALFSAPVR